MKPIKNLGAEYVFAGEFDANNRRVIVALNLVGVVLLFLFGWLFFQIALAIRPEIENISGVLSGLNLLGLVLGVVVVLILHEVIHGIFFWLFARARPRFGLHIFYAYAAAPDWYFPRNHFLVIGLAPFVCLTLVGLSLLPIVSVQVVPVLILALSFNAAGSVGDFAVTGWLATQPKTLMIHDFGPRMSFYKLAEPPVVDMSRRWLQLMDSLEVDQEQARKTFADLVSHYTETGRHYHNLEHVKELLDTVDELQVLAVDIITIRLAVWFHDVIYDPRADDNEARSAEYAVRALRTFGLPPEDIERVRNLILVTVDHEAPADDIDAQILIDADLAPLGSDENLFERQSKALRKEFAWVPEEEYQANRARFLTSFLERERIFQTDELFDSLESQARRNISKSLSTL